MLNQSSSKPSRRISSIATELNLFTFQGVAATPHGPAISTLDNAIVTVTSEGQVSRLADLAMYGIPAGVAMQGSDLIVSVSAEEAGDLLVRVAPTGEVSVIADLIDVCDSFGAPFGVAVGDGYYVVAVATDVSSSIGCLVRVDPDGKVSVFADLPGQGIPFGVTRWQQGFAVVVEQGRVLQMSESRQFTTLVDLTSTPYGIPFGIASYGKNLVVTTNEGYVLQVAPTGTLTELANLKTTGFGIPAGVAIEPTSKGASPACLVTTTSGNLVRLTFT